MKTTPGNTGVGKKKNLKGNVDFRYENTLRLSFTEPAYDESDENEGEEDKDYIDNKLYKLLKPVSGDDIELDWRDDSEVEIHGVNQRKFYQMYDENFISLI